MTPLYDIAKTYAQNVEQGPCFQGEIPLLPTTPLPYSLFGYPLRSRLGIPAGPLLSAKWVTLAAALGFDVLTYKTIRSAAHSGHPLPNIVYVEPKGENSMHRATPPSSLDTLTITNSFGMPSQSPEFLLHDIAAARQSLSAGQLLIVSVVGTAHPTQSLLKDFIHTASLAKEAGAQVIEANFSCPNVERSEGSLYLHPKTVYEYASQIARAIHPLPLILKVGSFPHVDALRQLLIAAARAGAQAVCGLNSLSRKLEPPLDLERTTSGICGAAIRNDALAFVRDASRINQEEQCGLTLLGCGGIVRPEHFEEFFQAGADIALSATGMMWDPYLAVRAQQLCTTHPGAFPNRRNK